jgi:hypothetical protein
MPGARTIQGIAVDVARSGACLGEQMISTVDSSMAASTQVRSKELLATPLLAHCVFQASAGQLSYSVNQR